MYSVVTFNRALASVCLLEQSYSDSVLLGFFLPCFQLIILLAFEWKKSIDKPYSDDHLFVILRACEELLCFLLLLKSVSLFNSSASKEKEERLGTGPDNNEKQFVVLIIIVITSKLRVVQCEPPSELTNVLLLSE